MPRLPGVRSLPWMRVVWLAQIVVNGIRELEPSERRQARALIAKLARERRLSPKERLQLRQLARKVSKGAAHGAGHRRRRRR